MLLDKIAFPGLGLKFDIDPVAFRLFGGKEIYWYGIIIVTGLIIAVALAIFNGKKVGISSDKIRTTPSKLSKSGTAVWQYTVL